MSDYLLEASGLGWVAPDGKKILSGASFGLEPGQMVWLSGPSGGGKSTLLRLLNRLISPHEGSLMIMGRPMEEIPPWEARRRVLLVGQTPAVLGKTINQNVLAPFAYRSARLEIAPTPEMLSVEFGLLGLAELGLDREMQGLSVGQLQRMCLCRALLLKPSVLLLDEPLAPLDPEAADLVEKRLAEFAGQGGTVLMVSHQRPVTLSRHLVLIGGRVEEGQ